MKSQPSPAVLEKNKNLKAELEKLKKEFDDQADIIKGLVAN